MYEEEMEKKREQVGITIFWGPVARMGREKSEHPG